MPEIKSTNEHETEAASTPPQVEIHVTQDNDMPSTNNLHNIESLPQGTSYEMRKKRIKLGSSSLLFSQSLLPSAKPPYEQKYRSFTEPEPQKQLTNYSHIAPKLPGKYSQILSKLKTYHPLDYQAKQQSPKRTHKCKFCDRVFLSNNDLKRHIRLHTGDRPFKCQECTKTYTRNDHLRRHMKQKHKTDFLPSEIAKLSQLGKLSSNFPTVDEVTSMLDDTTGMIIKGEENALSSGDVENNAGDD